MHVGIVGAGISGLYSALLLRREGHTVTVFESEDRLGGRIFTHRFTPQSGSADVYFEVGAMRIPRSSLHSKVFDLIRYLNTHCPAEAKIELIPYILDHENNSSFFRNKKGKLQDPSWAAKAGLPEKYHNKTPQELLGSVVLPWLNILRKDFDSGFQVSLRCFNYLRFQIGWSHEVIELVELSCSQTNQYDLSFTEIIIQNLDFDTKDWATVKDGMSRIPQSAAALIGSQNIRLNSKVERISYLEDGRVELSAQGLEQPYVGQFDAVIMAIPPSAVHRIVDRPQWSFMKEQAIRGSHFEPLYKIGLHFRTRFWERSTRSPCFGGQSTTDLRFRWIVFPSNDLGKNTSGVLLLYSWMSDALKWGALSRAERIKICLHDLNKFYSDEPGVDVYSQFLEAFDVLWSNENAGGDAMFLPGQFTRFYEAAKQPEGRIYFAGEHLSRHHTWIAGAVDSALCATADLLGRTIQGQRLLSKDGEEINDPPNTDRSLAPLGREFLTKDALLKNQKTDISSRRFKACVIPKNENVQYVEAF
ncbi:hypothetical protein F5Y16DRAFT_424545 [Xylariaceae sp. FL0255]|nr:hypothetical protein F5Y16DRAFT_424545 [Xylariaceae sp. FL0255]